MARPTARVLSLLALLQSGGVRTAGRAGRLAAVRASLPFAAPPGEAPAPDTAVLLSIADAVRHRRPVWIRYTAGDGRRSERTLHPYGLVAHSGRWYVTGADPGIGEDRTFRLDRIADTRTLPGSFEPPTRFHPAHPLLSRPAPPPHPPPLTPPTHPTPRPTLA